MDQLVQGIHDADWSWVEATGFLDAYADELPIAEELPEITPTAKPVEEGQLPKEIVIRVRYRRRRTESRSKIIQIGQNELLVTCLRENDVPYPGFVHVLEAFMESLARYREEIGFSAVELVELHYVDLIIVPELFASHGPTGLKVLFVGAPEPPRCGKRRSDRGLGWHCEPSRPSPGRRGSDHGPHR